MRHRVAGRKLGRTSEHRLAMLRNMSTALFEREKIRTTLAKAKELRPFAEKLLTMSKRETLHARRLVLRHVKDPKVVTKLFDSLSARYAQRPGGYTRIIKLGPRRGDNAEMAIIELVGAEAATAVASGEAAERAKGKKATRKTASKKAEAEATSEKKADEKKAGKNKKKTTSKKKAGSTAGASKSAKKATTKKKAAARKKKASTSKKKTKQD